MELEEAIARHRRTREELHAYAASGMLDHVAFSRLAEANLTALNFVVYAEEAEDDAFFRKLRYLALDDAARFSEPPAVWQPHGALRLAVWRRFGWSAENWPREAAGAS